MVDLNQSFAPGQVYVALSRCTSIDGLVLRSKLSIENVITDQRVADFAESEHEEDELEELLVQSRRKALASHLGRIFSFMELIAHTDQLLPEILKRKTGPREKNIELHGKIVTTLRQAQGHALGFQKQINALVAALDDDRLEERKRAAVNYFSHQVLTPLISSIDEHITSLGTLTKVAKQVKTWKDLNVLLKQKQTEINALT